MKTFLIDAIIGCGFPTFGLAHEAERVGMADFCGNQANPRWEWHREKLEALDENHLQALYQGLREAREDQVAVSDPWGIPSHEQKIVLP